MKKITTTLVITLLITINLQAQNLSHFSAYTELIHEQKEIEFKVLELLIDKELIFHASQDKSKRFPFTFMLSKKEKTNNLNKLCGKIMRKHISEEEYLAMDKETFVCKDIYLSEGVYCQKATIIKLYNEKYGNLYYLFNPDLNFPFEIKSVIKTPENFLCNTVTEEHDKFSNKTTYRTNHKGLGDDGITDNIMFHKTIKDGKYSFFMRIRKFANTPDTGKGVTILFEDGTKIYKAIKTKVEVAKNFLTDKSEFEHTALFKLEKTEIEKLEETNMEAIRLYIYDQEVHTPWKYKAYVNCLTKIQ